jgi:dihydroflavonol-4-reductase
MLYSGERSLGETMKKALVLGATGHIGNAVTRELLRREYQVTGIGRRPPGAENLTDLSIRYIVGNHDQPERIEAWVAGHDLVVDAAAPIPLAICNLRSAEDGLVRAQQRTDAIVQAVWRHGASLCYVSSPSTFKRWGGTLDDWPAHLIRRLHPYFRMKDMIEERILEAARQGLRVTIVNPMWCFGPWDSRPRSLCLIPLLLRGQIPATMNHILNVIDVRDVAAALVEAIETERYGRPILLSGYNISAHLLFSWICEFGGVQAPSFSIPPFIAALGGIGLELVASIFHREPRFKSLGPIMLYQHEFVPISETMTELGVKLRPFYQTLVDAISWYRRIGYC